MKGIKMAMISQNKFLNGVFIAMNDLNLLTTTISSPSEEIVDLVASLGIHFAGIDLSSKGHQLAFIDEKNKLVNISIKQEELKSTLKELAKKGLRLYIAMEACCGCHKVANDIKRCNHDVVILTAESIKGTEYRHRNKSDQRDAEMIMNAGALHLVNGICQAVTCRSELNMLQLGLLKAREQFITAKDRIMRCCNAMLRESTADTHSYSDPASVLKDLFDTLRALDVTDADDIIEGIIQGYKKAVEGLVSALAEVNKAIIEVVAKNKSMQRIKSIPYVSDVTAFAFVAVVGDISRFKNSRQLASYLGVCPRITGTGGKTSCLDTRYKGIAMIKRIFFQCGMSYCKNLKSDKYSGSKRHDAQAYANYIARVGFNLLKKDTFYDPEYQGKRSINKYEYQSRKVNKVIEADNVAA